MSFSVTKDTVEEGFFKPSIMQIMLLQCWFNHIYFYKITKIVCAL